MPAGKRSLNVVVGILLLGASGCERPLAIWSPMEEEVTTGWLRREAAEAEKRLSEAREQLSTDPAAASAALAEAEAALRRLSSYYLPVLEARERAYNAYWFLQQGDTQAVSRELELIENQLIAAARSRTESEAREIEMTMEQVAAARLALKSSPKSVPEMLASLARRLNAMLVKGELIVK